MIIGLTGYARAGKDTVGQILVEEVGFTRLAFADLLREAAYRLNPWVRESQCGLADIVDDRGWEHAKTYYLEVRRFLQRLGTEVARDIFGQDVWIRALFSSISDSTGGLLRQDYVITDVRFPNEADAIRSRAFSSPGGGHIWRVTRPHLTPVNAHPSETAMLDYPYIAATVVNDKTEEDLAVEVLSHYNELVR